MARGPDQRAVSLLRRRDPRGFDLAYATYGGRVRAFLLRLSGRSDAADDLLEHTFLRLAERGTELRADSDLRSWLFTVARNAYLDQARAVGGGRDDGALEALASPASHVEARLLLGVEGLDPGQVAGMLGVEPATLRQRLARARARLLATLERLPGAAGQPKKAMP